MKLPPLTERKARRACVERLRGATTSAAWLPEGAWPELDEVRSHQLRVRDQLARAVRDLESAAAEWRAEDEAHAAGLRQAHRDGHPQDATDDRTSPADRGARRAQLMETIEAATIVLAEVGDDVIALVRKNEDAWLADLRSKLGPAQQKRLKAQQLLREAESAEFAIFKLGQWVQQTADDLGISARQPAPNPSERPPARLNVDVLRDSLQRPWHKRRDWNLEEVSA